ncbi:hypothetical protein M5W68_09990 [Paenibacillus larvae]|uniref:hypothetical protein n=1 Tax=Paenibacillus larvae TaxID=1464 RepID=UPI002282E479|nr:hypothetical protein [Paenibacillus larvae]MCY9511551.1 hypothetical protein [Paenibacillus larvae]MCY9525442.1 hypothetical protein [Paenibacillus larvae]
MASFVPAIPLFIGLTELLALLTALGLAGIAQQFLKEVYKHGMAWHLLVESSPRKANI